MNYKLKAETLRPVHIGNGEELQENIDFQPFSKVDAEDDSSEPYLGVWNLRKLVKMLGSNNFGRFKEMVMKGDSPKSLVKAVASGVKLSSLYSREIQVMDTQKVNVVKECMHTGLGNLYIPGSSLKGSILTAMVSHSLGNQKVSLLELENNSGRLSDSNLMEKAIGRDMGLQPNRFLQIPDLSFAGYVPQAWYSGTFNLKGDKVNPLYKWEKETMGYLETIPPYAEAEAKLKINQEALNLWMSKERAKVRDKVKMVGFLDNPEKLMAAVNKNYSKLLQREIAYWDNQQGRTDDEQEVVEKIRQESTEMLEELKGCKPNEAVLRVGAGSGYTMLSGGLLDNLEEENKITSAEKHSVVLKLRRKNYGEAPFPKTRKISVDGYLLGFVKIAIEQE